MAVNTSEKKKTVRMETRLSAELKEKLATAAQYRGCSVTDFVLSSAAAAAEEIIQAHTLIQLSARDLQAFREALAHPPLLDDKMRQAAGRHRDLVEVVW